MQALDTIASPEIIREGTNFADRFGWEALAIIILLIFTLVFVWRYGGKVMDALVEFIQETKSQIVQLTALEAKQAESFADLARSMASLSTAQSECLNHCKLSNDYT